MKTESPARRRDGGVRLQEVVQAPPGVRMTLSKRGASVSRGPRGAKLSVNTRLREAGHRSRNSALYGASGSRFSGQARRAGGGMLLADISGGSAKGSTRGSRGMLGISPLLDKLNALVTASPPRAEALSLWACYVPPLKRAGDGRASGRACLGNSAARPPRGLRRASSGRFVWRCHAFLGCLSRETGSNPVSEKQAARGPSRSCSRPTGGFSSIRFGRLLRAMRLPPVNRKPSTVEERRGRCGVTVKERGLR